MMKAKKGYSMVVLVIAITVILILATSVISVLQVSREKTEITNFIFDLTTVEEEVKNFYTRTGTLPVNTLEKIDMEVLNQTSNGILSQLNVYDNDNYYYIDLNQLGTITIKDTERKYIVNEGSLRVYVAEGTEYASTDNDATRIEYFTLTPELVDGLDQYESQDEEMLVVGNPVAWTEKASLRLVLPRKSLTSTGSDSWEDWIFKWDFGPKTAEEMAAIPENNSAKNFTYGDLLTVKSNGIYTIYVKDNLGQENILNVNVTKIDDKKPLYQFDESELLQLSDNETGIKTIKYKTLTNYKNNVLDANQNDASDLEGRTEIDFYLLDGVGKDLIYDLPAEIATFKAQIDTIEKAMEDEEKRHADWLDENQGNMSLLTPTEIEMENQKYMSLKEDLTNQLDELKAKYPYIVDTTGKMEDGSWKDNDSWRLVVYVEDYAGNAVVIGETDLESEFISTQILANSFNIDLTALQDID